MDITGIEYFISTAKHLNFTKAATECCITQTAMSLHIAKIEKELGFKLFLRDSRSVSLTPGGKTFLEEALKILKHYRAGVSRSASAAAGYEGSLRVGFSNYIDRAFLPDFIRHFHEHYPQIEIFINKNEYIRNIDDLKQGLSDVSIIFPYDAAGEANIAVKKISAYPVAAVVPKNHQLSWKECVSLGELENESIIVSSRRSSPLLFQRVQEDWQECGFYPKAVIEADSPDAILFMVEAGFGCALMPSCIRQLAGCQFKMLELEGNPYSVDMAVAYDKESNNPVLGLFLAALKEFIEKENP